MNDTFLKTFKEDLEKKEARQVQNQQSSRKVKESDNKKMDVRKTAVGRENRGWGRSENTARHV